ncbi:uncharacterized protein LOC123558060 [Mercenaria mercenaria]|uniref:uncharacterized protein LOC123558060 n=1 Tax=Mercenaria mercenaria TaxID=6596 RepID=UPI00234F2978|nr:uncharacterized protein LOC123558060 [Mercenaria mercenaria]XP_053398493.1 uncharacterized protein LOC123558060 [Mercenaria mercenaria]
MIHLTLILAVTLTYSFPGVFCQQTRVLEKYTSHPCIRPCQVNQPMTCSYDFQLELYFTLTKACYDCPFNRTDCFRPHCIPADGVSRGLNVINRMLPGPGIHVCEGDTVIVNVKNDLTGGEGTSIHWHGILQHGSQHMDGVGMVTQCPIPQRTSFQYRFKAENPGTHYWHAHSGLQRSDGAYGAIVVRQAPEFESHLGLYDEDLPEHTMLVNDWLVEMSVNRFAHHHQAGGDNKPRSMLINGKGVLQEFFDNSGNTSSYTPVEIFHVTRGKRYRFRTISNGILNCPTQISIDGHTLTMMASDGNPFDKIEVDSFNIFPGERFDFMLNASQPVGNYWVRARGLADCGVKQAKQVAILRYEGASEEDPVGNTTWEDADRMGKKLNPWNKKGDENNIQVSDLKSRLDGKAALKVTPDKKFYLAMDFNKIDNYHFHDVSFYPISAVERPQHLYMPQMNHVTLRLPSSPPLSQHSDLDEGEFCNHMTTGSKNCTEEFCECVYRLHVQLNDTVEIIVIDEGVTFNANHPVHLHGYKFYVVGMDRLGESTSLEEVKRLDVQGRLPRNLVDPVAKDTVTVPDGGYSILRFHADNPGFWFFHCHIEFHANIGMGLLVQVGNESDMPKVPKNFPKCGNWQFTGYDEPEEDKQCVSGATSIWSVMTVSLTVITGGIAMGLQQYYI